MHKILAVAVGPSQKPAVQPNVIQKGHLGNLRSIIQGMVQGLQALGYTPGISFDVDYAEAEPHLLPTLLRGALKESKPDVIYTVGTSARRAAQTVTKAVPIVFTVVSDPIEEKAVNRPAAPEQTPPGCARCSAIRRPTAWSSSGPRCRASRRCTPCISPGSPPS